MPSLFRIGGYLVFFWSNENNEPIHVHIVKGKPSPNATKVWLTQAGQCIVANNSSKIPQNDLNELLDVISAQFFMICQKWKEHFKVEEIRFVFCCRGFLYLKRTNQNKRRVEENNILPALQIKHGGFDNDRSALFPAHQRPR